MTGSLTLDIGEAHGTSHFTKASYPCFTLLVKFKYNFLLNNALERRDCPYVRKLCVWQFFLFKQTFRTYDPVCGISMFTGTREHITVKLQTWARSEILDHVTLETMECSLESKMGFWSKVQRYLKFKALPLSDAGDTVIPRCLMEHSYCECLQVSAGWDTGIWFRAHPLPYLPSQIEVCASSWVPRLPPPLRSPRRLVTKQRPAFTRLKLIKPNNVRGFAGLWRCCNIHTTRLLSLVGPQWSVIEQLCNQTRTYLLWSFVIDTPRFCVLLTSESIWVAFNWEYITRLVQMLAQL